MKRTKQTDFFDDILTKRGCRISATAPKYLSDILLSYGRRLFLACASCGNRRACLAGVILSCGRVIDNCCNTELVVLVADDASYGALCACNGLVADILALGFIIHIDPVAVSTLDLAP